MTNTTKHTGLIDLSVLMLLKEVMIMMREKMEGILCLMLVWYMDDILLTMLMQQLHVMVTAKRMPKILKLQLMLQVMKKVIHVGNPL